MRKCALCGQDFETGAGLASHRRAKHATHRGPNRRAIEKTLAVLRGLGRLEDIDAARIQTVRSLADVLDADDSNANMWRVYRDTVEALMDQDEHANTSLEQALAEIRSAPTLGDAT